MSHLPQTDGILLGAALLAGLAGFWACCSLYSHTRRRGRRRCRPMALQCVYAWGAVFFAGATLLAVNQTMGPGGPVWFLSPGGVGGHGGPPFAAGFSAPVIAWTLLCLAGLAIQRAGRMWRA
jgi:hypothetical protein